MASQIIITGTLEDVGGNDLQTPSGFVRFRLRNFQGFVPVISGTSIIAEPQIDAQPNSSGYIDVLIWGNNNITPANTFYTVEFWSNGRITSSGNYVFNVNTDLGSASPINPAPNPSLPTIAFLNNGLMNSSQIRLNLESTDDSVAIVDDGNGNINLSAAGGGGGFDSLGGFWGGGWPMMAPYGLNMSQENIEVVGAGDLLLWQFALVNSWTISKVTVGLQASGSTGCQSYFGLYNSSGQLVLNSGSFASDAAPGILTNSITPVVLPVGIYYLFAADGSPRTEGPAPYFYTWAPATGANAQALLMVQASSTKVGIGANAVTKVSGPPTNTGLISATNTEAIPAVFFSV
jgi:hypothetical protein